MSLIGHNHLEVRTGLLSAGRRYQLAADDSLFESQTSSTKGDAVDPLILSHTPQTEYVKGGNANIQIELDEGILSSCTAGA